MTDQQPGADPRFSAPSAASAAVPPPPAPPAQPQPGAPSQWQSQTTPQVQSQPQQPAWQPQPTTPQPQPYQQGAPVQAPVQPSAPVAGSAAAATGAYPAAASGHPLYSAPSAAQAPGALPFTGSAVQQPAAPGAVGAELKRLVTGAGLLTWGALVAVALVTAVVSGLLILWTLDVAGATIPGASVVSEVLVGGGVALGGRLTAAIGSDLGTAHADLVMLGPLLVIGVVTALIVRRRARFDSAPATLPALALRSLAEGLGVGVVSALVLGIPSVSILQDQEVASLSDLLNAAASPTLSASWGRVLALTLVATALGSFIGRWSVCGYLPQPTWVQRLRPLWAELSAALVALAAVLGAAALLAFIALAVEERVAVLLLAPLLLPNAAVWIASLGTFSGLSVSGSVSSEYFTGVGTTGSHYLSTPSLPNASGWLCVLVILIAAVVVAARVGVRRQRAVGVQWQRVWQLPLAFWLVWAVLYGLGGAVSGSGDSTVLGAGSMRVGPSTVALLTLPIACLITSVLAELVPLFLYQNANGLLVRVGGRDAVGRWAAGVPLYPAVAPAGRAGALAPAGAQPGLQPAVPGAAPVAAAYAAPGPVAPSAPVTSSAPAASAPSAPLPSAASAPAPTGQPPAWAPAPTTASAPEAPGVGTGAAASAEPATEVITPAGPMAAPVPPPPPSGPAAPWTASAPMAPSAPVAPSAAAAPGSAYAAQPAAAAPAAPGALPPIGAPKPMSASSRRNVRLGLIAVAALAVVGIVVGVWAHVENSSRTAEAAARDYVQLIADGKFSEATKDVDPGVSNSQRALLTDDAVAGRTSTLTIESVEEGTGTSRSSARDGDVVPVTVTYQVDGERFTRTLDVKRAGDDMLLLHNWDVQDALIEEAQISGNGISSVTVGSAEVALTSTSSSDSSSTDTELGGTADVYVYPGTYTVKGPAKVSKYVTVDDQTLTAADPQAGHSVSLTAEASDDLRAAVLQAVEDKVTSCGSTSGNMDDACPYAVQDSDLSAIDVKTLPTEITDLMTTSFTSGDATITITPNPTEFDSDPSSQDVDFTMSGTIELKADGSEPTITVTSSSGSY